MVVKFGLLGSLVVHDGTEPRPVTGPKVRILLAALLLDAGRTVPRDTLKAALWGDSVPASADASLANHLTRLRRVLADSDGTAVTGRAAPADGGTEGRLRTVAPGYRLHVREGELDADVFETRIRAARQAHEREEWEAVLRETAAAMSLWRGTPLADLAPFSETEGPALRVHQLLEARLQALEWSCDAELHLGRHHDLIPQLTTLAAEQPLREGFHQRLMLALHRSGRQAEAFSVFHRLRRNLVDQLGTEPGAAVQQAHQEVLAGAPAPRPRPRPRPRPEPARPPFQLPCEGEAFTGREPEAAALRSLLTADAPSRPVVISGMGGVGKTALAVHVAHRVREAYPDGALFADLRGYCVGGARTAHELLARFLSDLGVRHDSLPDDTDDRALLFRTALAERRVLLVLDNARNAAHVAALLPAGGPSAALITSRQLLADLPGAVKVPLAPLAESDQHALLARLCGEERVRREPEALADIMTACGGLPLALHIVGGRLASRPAWPLALLAKRLTPTRAGWRPSPWAPSTSSGPSR